VYRWTSRIRRLESRRQRKIRGGRIRRGEDMTCLRPQWTHTPPWKKGAAHRVYWEVRPNLCRRRKIAWKTDFIRMLHLDCEGT
jgi:hypothetical protein